MIYQITDSTDGKFKGTMIELNSTYQLSEDFLFVPDRKIPLLDGTIRMYNSNYSIDIKEVANG